MGRRPPPGTELVKTAGESKNELCSSVQNKNNWAGTNRLLRANSPMSKHDRKRSELPKFCFISDFCGTKEDQLK